LEAYGLANLLNKYLQANNSITLHATADVYEIRLNQPLNMDNIQYSPLFKYIKTKIDSDVSKYPDYYDYPLLKSWKDEKKELLKKARKETDNIKRRNEIKRIETDFNTNRPIPAEFDVVTQFVNPNVFSGFDKLYHNLSENKELFSVLINEIISYYSNREHGSTKFDKLIKKKSKAERIEIKFDKTPTATQLLNPNQGKGLKAAKANCVSGGNLKSNWISETMKISGSLSDMICQLVKVGTSYDLKVFVPEYKEVNYSNKLDLIKKFKKHLKGNTPVKIDILNILLLTQLVIDHFGFTGVRRKVKDIVSGLHSVYQKDLGRNKAVMNIGFIQMPDFVEINSREDCQTWIDILEEQIIIIRTINELGSTTQGLLLYRDFISGGNLNNFFQFSFWYAMHLLTELSNKKYTRPFSIETLNKLYNSMDTNDLRLSEIIANGGFKAVAEAIRKSTVVLLYAPKEARQYEVRFGVAQALQSKARSSADLAEYIGEFISLYNSETAMKADKNIKYPRSSVREDDLTAFYSLLDKHPSKLVGALLASYGFALPAKESNSQQETEDDSIEQEEN
jgi:hypothetical protein